MWEYTSGAPPAGWGGAGYPTDAMQVSQSEKQRNCRGRDIAVRLWRDPCVPLRTAARDMTDPSGAGVALASSGAGGREFPRRGMQGGHGKDARGVTAIRQVAGAYLAYCFLISNRMFW